MCVAQSTWPSTRATGMVRKKFRGRKSFLTVFSYSIPTHPSAWPDFPRQKVLSLHQLSTSYLSLSHSTYQTKPGTYCYLTSMPYRPQWPWSYSSVPTVPLTLSREVSVNACGLARRQKQQLGGSCLLVLDTRKEYATCANEVQRRKGICNYTGKKNLQTSFDWYDLILFFFLLAQFPVCFVFRL